MESGLGELASHFENNGMLGEFAQTDKNSHRIFVRSWFYVGFSQIVAFQI